MNRTDLEKTGYGGCLVALILSSISLLILSGCSDQDLVTASPSATRVPTTVQTPVIIPTTNSISTRQAPSTTPSTNSSRGYLTTPGELHIIKEKATLGLEPYRSAVDEVLAWADKSWDLALDEKVRCSESNQPSWNFNNGGTPILYAKALAYHLTGTDRYAQEANEILQRIMAEVKTVSTEDQSCRLNLAWGTPELVATADLIEDYWKNKTCSGPPSTSYTDTTIGLGNCKVLFQNWLIKNPYYIVSYSAEASQSNWGAAATNTTAYIADYLWDRPDAILIHRNPTGMDGTREIHQRPAEAYAYANKLALSRMNGYGIEYGSSSSCDYLSGRQQSSKWPPVKSQITENGIIPEDARREEYCNIQEYNGKYQNYPQLHLGHNIQQCELMLRRGDPLCFDNVDLNDLPNYSFLDPGGKVRVTHLRPGRGSIERAIKAIIVDSETEWRHDSALQVAYHYYFNFHTLPGFEKWSEHLNQAVSCSQDICFGQLTHGFAPFEKPNLPPTVLPPL